MKVDDMMYKLDEFMSFKMHLATSVIFATATYLNIAAAVDTTLEPWTFIPLPLGSITPNGWLKSELQIMASGLAGHEHDFYSYVHNSSWLGGRSEYSELNEGFPYWFNGLVPLAYGLGDERLKNQVHVAADYVLAHQQDDGWIGPEYPGYRTFWGRYPLFLGLTQLAEANATAWKSKVTNGMHAFFPLMNEMLKNNGSGYLWQQGDHISPDDFDWGRVRSQDMMISVMWLLENDPRNRTEILTDNLQMLYDMGFKWEAWYSKATFPKADLNTLPQNFTTPNYHFEHGVNVAQGLKATAVYQRFTHNVSLTQTTHDGVNWTFQYHGSSSGTIIADERMAGQAPFSGAELCTAVETMYSLSYLYQALGTNSFADRCELTAFNALPAMVTSDWWAHQYMEQENQPYGQNLSQTPFYNTNIWGQTFGLEPNYPCCTVNHPQGLPKYLSASFVKIGDNGMGHALLSPAKATTQLSSGKVAIDCQTNYPFADTLSYTIESDGAFDFYIRVPTWASAQSSTVTLNGTTTKLSPDANTGMTKLSLSQGSTSIDYTLSTTPIIETRPNDTVAIHRGSLLYALEIKANVTSTPPKAWNNNQVYTEGYAPAESRDYIMTNTTAWSVAIDPSTLTFTQSNDTSLASPIFAPGVAPVSMTVKACEIDWLLYMGSVPGYPPPVDTRKCTGPVFDAKLIPYGGAKLHMAELPTVDLSSS